jgi:hypothetical protein
MIRVVEVREVVTAAPAEPPPARPRRDRLTPAVGWLAAALAVAAVAGSAALDLATPPEARDAVDSGTGWEIGLSGLLLAVPAALLLSRAPRNAVSWVVAGTAVFWALDGLASSWLTYAVQSDPPLPGASLSFWFVQRFGAWLLFGLPLLLLLYPDGRLPADRWRTVSWVALGCTALLPVLVVTTPAEILDRRAGSTLPEAFVDLNLDPTSLPLSEVVVLPLLHLAFPLTLVGILLPLAVVVHRLRAAGGDARRRMRWLLWAGVVDVLVMSGALLFPSTRVSLDLALAIGLTGLAVTLGILRPRAVDIDRLLGGTLVYGGLAAGVVVLDLLVLGTAGLLLDDRFDERNALLVTLLIVAVGYVPLRAALWRIVRRWALGEREDPYRVVAGLAERLERSDDADQQLMAVASAVSEAFRSPYVGVEVTSPGGQRLLAEHGHRPAAVQSLPITYRGEDIGRLLLPVRGVRARLLPRDERLLAPTSSGRPPARPGPSPWPPSCRPVGSNWSRRGRRSAAGCAGTCTMASGPASARWSCASTPRATSPETGRRRPTGCCGGLATTSPRRWPTSAGWCTTSARPRSTTSASAGRSGSRPSGCSRRRWTWP